jgi:hypothetical protein
MIVLTRYFLKSNSKARRAWANGTRPSISSGLAYIEQVLAHPIFPDTVFFSHYTETQAYFDLTVETTAKAVLHKASSEYTTTVTVERSRSQAPCRR